MKANNPRLKSCQNLGWQFTRSISSNKIIATTYVCGWPVTKIGKSYTEVINKIKKGVQ